MPRLRFPRWLRPGYLLRRLLTYLLVVVIFTTLVTTLFFAFVAVGPRALDVGAMLDAAQHTFLARWVMQHLLVVLIISALGIGLIAEDKWYEYRLKRQAQHVEASQQPQSSLANVRRALRAIVALRVADELRAAYGAQGQTLLLPGVREDRSLIRSSWEPLVRETDLPPLTFSPGTEMEQIYAQMGGSLALLGEQGAGKTTLAFSLMDALLRASPGEDSDTPTPIPVPLALKTWALKPMPLDDWLAKQLADLPYRIPQDVGRSLVASQAIMPCLDGLDDMPDTLRDDCIDAINTYLSAHGPAAQMLVTCRYEAYANARQRLEMLHGPLVIEPLTQKQVEGYLEQIGTTSAGLRQALQASHELSDLARTPLLLSLMARAYDDMGMENIPYQEGRQRIFRDYVVRMLVTERRRRAKRQGQIYPPDRLFRWLRWLAAQLRERPGQETFYIERLQPDWLEEKQQRRFGLFWRLVQSLVFGIVCGGIGWVIIEFGLGQLVGPTVSQLGGLAIGLLTFVILFGASLIKMRHAGAGPISLHDQFRFSWRGLLSSVGSAYRAMPRYSAIWLALGAIGGVLVAFGDWVASHYQGGLSELEFLLLMGLVAGSAVGLIFAIVWGIGFGLVIGVALNLLMESLTASDLRVVGYRTPNEGIRRTAFSGFMIMLVTVLVSSLVFFPFGVAERLMGLGFGSFAALSFGWIFGLDDAFRHYALRIRLAREGVAPLNYGRFLIYASRLALLKRFGGGFQFPHALIQNYFAGLTPGEIEEITRRLDAAT